MSTTVPRSRIVARRAELTAELFLQELQPQFVARAGEEFAYDFLIGFPNPEGGVNTYAIEVKGTEDPVDGKFRVKGAVYDRMAHSNISVLLLVVDVKHNRLYHAWPKDDAIHPRRGGTHVTIPVTEIDDEVRTSLRNKMAGSIV